MKKGGILNRSVGETSGDEIERETKSNFIFSFGCAPRKTVNKKSGIAFDYFKHLKRNADSIDGTVILPAAISNW